MDKARFNPTWRTATSSRIRKGVKRYSKSHALRILKHKAKSLKGLWGMAEAKP
jgi:hypothetical protein